MLSLYFAFSDVEIAVEVEVAAGEVERTAALELAEAR